MEAVYRTFIGKSINPKKPYEAIGFQIKILKVFGMWAPETKNANAQAIYKFWTFFCRGFFLHLYTLTQLLYFKDVDDISGAAEGIFLLMTNIAMLFKLERFYQNRHRIKACAKILENSLFIPQDKDEELFIRPAMKQCLIFCLSLLMPAFITCHLLAIAPFFADEIRLPFTAWYPFSTENSIVFVIVYFYQHVGVLISAAVNTAQDTIASSFIAHCNGQLKILGHRMTKIGQQNIKNNQDNEEELVECVKRHKFILRFIKELEDIFGASIFAQFCAAVMIICMTLFLMAKQNSFVAMAPFISYLNTMTVQIFLFCWIGNELIYSSKQLTYNAFQSNIITFNRKTSKTLLMVMTKTLKDVKFMAGAPFRVELSLQTFLDIMKASYSYFTVLRSVG